MKRYIKFVKHENGDVGCKKCDFYKFRCACSIDFDCSGGVLKKIKQPTPEQIKKARSIGRV